MLSKPYGVTKEAVSIRLLTLESGVEVGSIAVMVGAWAWSATNERLTVAMSQCHLYGVCCNVAMHTDCESMKKVPPLLDIVFSQTKNCDQDYYDYNDSMTVGHRPCHRQATLRILLFTYMTMNI